MKWRVTYEIVTPESAMGGDAAERGFVWPGGWHDPDCCEMDLRAALDLCSPQEDSGRWLSEADGWTDYRTGAIETRSLHPSGPITESSYRRLCALVGVQRNG